MDSGASYISSMKSIDQEIKRINERAKHLRMEKKKIQGRLYTYMKTRQLSEYGGYKLDKLAPVEKTPGPKKKKKEKVRDALDLCRNAGLPDPEGFYQEFLRTQKVILN